MSDTGRTLTTLLVALALAGCEQTVGEGMTDAGSSTRGSTGGGSGGSSSGSSNGSSGRTGGASSGSSSGSNGNTGGASSGSSSGSSGSTGGVSSVGGSSGSSGSTGAASSGGSSGSSGGVTLVGTATRIVGNGDIEPNGTLCGLACYADGPADQAMFQQLSGLAVVGRTLYAADLLNEAIRAIDLSSAPTYTVSTLAGNPASTTTQDGTGTAAGFFLPLQPLAYEGTLLVGTGMNIRQITLPGAVVTTLAGPNSGNKASENSTFPVSFSQAFFNNVMGLTVDPTTGLLYTVDHGSGFVHELNPVAETVDYIAGASKLAAFSDPTSGVVVDGVLFVSDTGNDEVDAISLGSPTTVTLVAGAGGTGFSDDNKPYNDVFNAPAGLCTDGTSLYIVDQGNKAIRKMDPVSYALSTVVGGPDAGVFNNPYGCAWDPVAGVLYVSDQSISPATPDGLGNVIYMVQ